MTIIEVIYSIALPIMKEHNIDDTLQNRHSFLQGLRLGWKEDGDTSIDKSLCMIALNGEIRNLDMKLRYLRIWA